MGVISPYLGLATGRDRRFLYSMADYFAWPNLLPAARASTAGADQL